MRTQPIHRMFSMIAMHIDGKVFAVFPSAYSDLINSLLPELDVMASASVRLAVGEFPTHGSPADAKAWPARQALLIARLKHRMPEFGDRLTFSVKGKEISLFLPGILEGYRGNHIGEFAFSIDEFHGSDRRVATLKFYDPPNLFQKLSKSERDARRSVVLPLDEIRSVSGTSVQLKIELPKSELRLGPDGLVGAGPY